MTAEMRICDPHCSGAACPCGEMPDEDWYRQRDDRATAGVPGAPVEAVRATCWPELREPMGCDQL